MIWTAMEWMASPTAGRIALAFIILLAAGLWTMKSTVIAIAAATMLSGLVAAVLWFISGFTQDRHTQRLNRRAALWTATSVLLNAAATLFGASGN